MTDELHSYGYTVFNPAVLPDGFEYVTCANYFWEFLSWLSFSLFSLHWSVFIFTILGFIQMRSWALKKHKEMCLNFGDLYPAQRKAFIPFFI